MKFRSLFVSDIHLGTKQCQVQYLLKFIHDHDFEMVYLVGDIVDVYSLKNKWFWHKDHNTFVQKILRLSRKGTHVVYIPGNHDECIRPLIEEQQPFFFGDIVITKQLEYVSLSGKKFLVIHGDEFDGAIRSMGWLYWVGDRAYDIALFTNRIYNIMRKWFGFEYWSLSAYLKSKVKKATQMLNNFDELVVRKCLIEGYDGVIYGHTHTPGIKTIKTKIIINDGDQCESMTALVETSDGEFKLIRLTDGTILDVVK